MAVTTCYLQWGPSIAIRRVGVCTIAEQPLRLSRVSSATGRDQFIHHCFVTSIWNQRRCPAVLPNGLLCSDALTPPELEQKRDRWDTAAL